MDTQIVPFDFIADFVADFLVYRHFYRYFYRYFFAYRYFYRRSPRPKRQHRPALQTQDAVSR